MNRYYTFETYSTNVTTYKTIIFRNLLHYKTTYLQELQCFLRNFYYGYSLPSCNFPKTFLTHRAHYICSNSYHYQVYELFYESNLDRHYFIHKICNCAQQQHLQHMNYNQITTNMPLNNFHEDNSARKFSNWQDYRNQVALQSKRNNFEVKNTKDRISINQPIVDKTEKKHHQEAKSLYSIGKLDEPPQTTSKEQKPEPLINAAQHQGVTFDRNKKPEMVSEPTELSHIKGAESTFNFKRKNQTNHNTPFNGQGAGSINTKYYPTICPKPTSKDLNEHSIRFKLDQDQKYTKCVQKQCEENRIKGPNHFTSKKEAASFISKTIEKQLQLEIDLPKNNQNDRKTLENYQNSNQIQGQSYRKEKVPQNVKILENPEPKSFKMETIGQDQFRTFSSGPSSRFDQNKVKTEKLDDINLITQEFKNIKLDDTKEKASSNEIAFPESPQILSNRSPNLEEQIIGQYERLENIEVEVENHLGRISSLILKIEKLLDPLRQFQKELSIIFDESNSVHQLRHNYFAQLLNVGQQENFQTTDGSDCDKKQGNKEFATKFRSENFEQSVDGKSDENPVKKITSEDVPLELSEERTYFTEDIPKNLAQDSIELQAHNNSENVNKNGESINIQGGRHIGDKNTFQEPIDKLRDNVTISKTVFDENDDNLKAQKSLNKIVDLHNEAENLIKEVEVFNGTSKDRQYVYLDEMITRVLLKLDNVEIYNNRDIRSKRKECIKFVKLGLIKLESKVE